MMLVEINNKLWEIHKVKSDDPLLYYDNSFSRGSTWCTLQIIAFSNDLNLYTAPGVILHELTHAFLWSTQLEVPNKFTEEQVCNIVADYGKQIIELGTRIYNYLYVEEHS